MLLDRHRRFEGVSGTSKAGLRFEGVSGGGLGALRADPGWLDLIEAPAGTNSMSESWASGLCGMRLVGKLLVRGIFCWGGCRPGCNVKQLGLVLELYVARGCRDLAVVASM